MHQFTPTTAHTHTCLPIYVHINSGTCAFHVQKNTHIQVRMYVPNAHSISDPDTSFCIVSTLSSAMPRPVDRNTAEYADENHNLTVVSFG